MIPSPYKAGALQTPVSSSSPPLVSPRSGRTASLFQNLQAPRYGWRLMLFRDQVAHTVLLDLPLQPRRAFHGNFAPCHVLPGSANMSSHLAIKKSSTKFAPNTAISSPSVTSLLLNIAKHCITNRLIGLQQEFSMLRLGKLLSHQRPLFT